MIFTLIFFFTSIIIYSLRYIFYLDTFTVICAVEYYILYWSVFNFFMFHFTNFYNTIPTSEWIIIVSWRSTVIRTQNIKKFVLNILNSINSFNSMHLILKVVSNFIDILIQIKVLSNITHFLNFLSMICMFLTL